jgi:RNA polymerase sigma-70 factor, ECF subfamily
LYYGRIYRLALFRCRSSADAEDVAAETFVKAVFYLPQYKFQGESLLPWLSRIATNLAADQGRKLNGQAPLSLDGAAGDVKALIESLCDGSPNPHELAERHETQSLVRAAIATLPPDQADVILLRFGGDLPIAEIALALGRTDGAIKSLIHRGLVNLKRRLLEESEQSGTIEHLRRTTVHQTESALLQNRHGTHIEL